MAIDEKAKVCNACLATLQKNAYKCSACKSVYYCSKQCQRKNWKQHKSYCRTKQKSKRQGRQEKEAHQNHQVLWAASELHNLVSDISLADAIEKYHRAQDDIKNLKSNLKIRGGPSTLESATDTATTTDNRVDASVPPEEKRNDFDSKSDHEGHDSFGDDECENERFRDESSAWNYTVEKLIFVSSFNVTLTRSCCFSNGQESTCPFPEKEHIHLKVHHDKSKKRGLSLE